MREEYRDLGSKHGSSPVPNFDYSGLQFADELHDVRTGLNELADELAYQLADQYVSEDNTEAVMIGTSEAVYDDVRAYLDEEGYEFEQLRYGNFQIEAVSKEDLGKLLRVIEMGNLDSVVDRTDKPRSVNVETTDVFYGDIVEHWAEEGYTPERLSSNTIHISEMRKEDIDDLMFMAGVESVMGSKPV